MSKPFWDHGYHSGSTYASGFYRELTPSWLDFGALLKGHKPPRESEGEPFVFLDLGCGTGFGLVLLAALYPEGRFFGVDFHPDHVAHGLDLARRAGVKNVEIIEADFLALAASDAVMAWPAGGCHYVVAHGIATWVTEPVQNALLAVATRSLSPGGLMYCSYNTYPGWLARSGFQKLLAFELATAKKGELTHSFQKTARLLNQLLGEESQPSPLGATFPGLRRELQPIEFAPLDYLCGEYDNVGWAPLYFTDMSARCQAHKLSFLGTATFSESFAELLPPPLRDVVINEARTDARELLTDLGTNKSFRRDILAKGHVQLTQKEWSERLAPISFRLLQPQEDWIPTPTQTLNFRSSFGEIQGDPLAYGPLITAISASPTSIQSLLNSNQQPQGELVVMLSLLLEAGCIGFDRGPAGSKSAPVVQQLNQLLLDRMQEGRSYTQFGLPAVGTAVPFSVLEALIYKAHRDQLEEPMLSSCVLLWLKELEVQLLDQDNQLITEPSAQIDRIQAIAAILKNGKEPLLQRMGGAPGLSLHQPRSDQSRRKSPARKGV